MHSICAWAFYVPLLMLHFIFSLFCMQTCIRQIYGILLDLWYEHFFVLTIKFLYLGLIAVVRKWCKSTSCGALYGRDVWSLTHANSSLPDDGRQLLALERRGKSTITRANCQEYIVFHVATSPDYFAHMLDALAFAPLITPKDKSLSITGTSHGITTALKGFEMQRGRSLPLLSPVNSRSAIKVLRKPFSRNYGFSHGIDAPLLELTPKINIVLSFCRSPLLSPVLLPNNKFNLVLTLPKNNTALLPSVGIPRRIEYEYDYFFGIQGDSTLTSASIKDLQVEVLLSGYHRAIMKYTKHAKKGKIGKLDKYLDDNYAFTMFKAASPDLGFFGQNIIFKLQQEFWIEHDRLPNEREFATLTELANSQTLLDMDDCIDRLSRNMWRAEIDHAAMGEWVVKKDEECPRYQPPENIDDEDFDELLKSALAIKPYISPTPHGWWSDSSLDLGFDHRRHGYMAIVQIKCILNWVATLAEKNKLSTAGDESSSESEVPSNASSPRLIRSITPPSDVIEDVIKEEIPIEDISLLYKTRVNGGWKLKTATQTLLIELVESLDNKPFLGHSSSYTSARGPPVIVEPLALRKDYSANTLAIHFKTATAEDQDWKLLRESAQQLSDEDVWQCRNDRIRELCIPLEEQKLQQTAWQRNFNSARFLKKEYEREIKMASKLYRIPGEGDGVYITKIKKWKRYDDDEDETEEEWRMHHRLGRPLRLRALFGTKVSIGVSELGSPYRCSKSVRI